MCASFSPLRVTDLDDFGFSSKTHLRFLLVSRPPQFWPHRRCVFLLKRDGFRATRHQEFCLFQVPGKGWSSHFCCLWNCAICDPEGVAVRGKKSYVSWTLKLLQRALWTALLLVVAGEENYRWRSRGLEELQSTTIQSSPLNAREAHGVASNRQQQASLRRWRSPLLWLFDAAVVVYVAVVLFRRYWNEYCIWWVGRSFVLGISKALKIFSTNDRHLWGAGDLLYLDCLTLLLLFMSLLCVFGAIEMSIVSAGWDDLLF